MQKLTNVTVCGAGEMGGQIAMAAALNGYTVALYDINVDQLSATSSRLESLTNRFVEKGRYEEQVVKEAFSNLTFYNDLSEACARADLVIEAIVEDLGAKQELFRQVSSLVDAGTVLATNSSSIVSSKLADSVSNPSRLLNVHFFNPALIMPLVEVVQGPHTDTEHVETAIEFARSLGKTPVLIEKEIFGFIANRVLSAIFDEAIYLKEQGVAYVEAIDTAVKQGLNHPMGPFELLDLTGIDVNYKIKKLEAEDTGDAKDGPSRTLSELYEAGHLGKKSGRGFYEYKKGGK